MGRRYDRRKTVTAQSFDKVCVLGAGYMGQVISLRFACVGGLSVAVYDNAQSSLDAAPALQTHVGETMVAMGNITREQFDAGRGRISFTMNAAEAAAEADVLSESVPDVLELKQRVHADFEKLLPSAALMTSNSSYLKGSDISKYVRDKSRYCNYHFNGFGGSLVDVMPVPETSVETIDAIRALSVRIGERPLVLTKEKAGYIYNSVLGDALLSAINLVVEGYADPETVDRACMTALPIPFGPFGVIDFCGLDILNGALQNYARERNDISPEKVAAFFKPYLAAGKRGLKSGEGIYTHPNPAYTVAGFLEPR